uniref:Sodium-and chloride-dependent betaine transporter n=1 Tax=Schistocephalus solidus TaxID=70667 RepID=A0A0X3P7Z8_SCHSO
MRITTFDVQKGFQTPFIFASKGVGYAGVFILFCLNCYYNVILSWIVFYLFASMTSTLPWNTCDNWWNTVNCRDFSNGSTANNSFSHMPDPVNEYWERRVLGLSPGIDTVGTVRWELALCLLLTWVIVFLCIFQGIRASSKILYFTAPSPLILMFILLIRTAMLDGASMGMVYYLKPDWTHLASVEVWSDAGTQIFFSYSISLGTLTALGSFNDFNHNSVRDTGIFAILNTCVSFLAGCIIFTTLGFMAKSSGVPISEVAEAGPGLAFIAYPKALSTMPLSPLWSVLFFLILLLLGLDSQFVGVEGFVTAAVDMFPDVLAVRRNRVLFTAATCILCYFVGLLMVTNGGIYVFQLFDYYVGSRIILVVAFFECFVIGFIFGARKFGLHLKNMYSMNFYYLPMVAYCIIAPLFSLTLFILSVIVYGKLTYKKTSGIYEYPGYATAFGWLLASCSVVFIPLVAVHRLVRAKGNFSERLRNLCKPNIPQAPDFNYTANKSRTSFSSDSTLATL